MQTEPIVAETVVPVAPTAAFVAWTAQMGEWWDPNLTPDAATFRSVEVDPDGEVAMVHDDARHVWGRVTAWDPPGRYEQDVWLGHDPEHPTSLRVRFVDEDGGTRVRLHHDGWTDATRAERERYAAWPALRERFAAHVS